MSYYYTDSIKINDTTYDFTIPNGEDLTVYSVDVIDDIYINGTSLKSMYAEEGHCHTYGFKVGVNEEKNKHYMEYTSYVRSIYEVLWGKLMVTNRYITYLDNPPRPDRWVPHDSSYEYKFEALGGNGTKLRTGFNLIVDPMNWASTDKIKICFIDGTTSEVEVSTLIGKTLSGVESFYFLTASTVQAFFTYDADGGDREEDGIPLAYNYVYSQSSYYVYVDTYTGFCTNSYEVFQGNEISSTSDHQYAQFYLTSDTYLQIWGTNY